MSGLVSKPFNKLSGLEYMVDFLKATCNKTGKCHIKKLKEPYFFLSIYIYLYKTKKVHLLSYTVANRTGPCKNFVSSLFIWCDYQVPACLHCAMQKIEIKLSSFDLSKFVSTQISLT